MNFWSLNYPNSDPADYTRQVAEKVDCDTDDTGNMVECMRDIEDPWEIRNNSGVMCTVSLWNIYAYICFIYIGTVVNAELDSDL